jgi:phage-related protein
VFADVNIAWTSVRAVAQKRDGTVAIGGTGLTSTGTAGATTTVTNTGTARSYPIITIKGPTSGTSRIYQITNYTTGRTIYLNYTINAGEMARMVFQPDNLSFTSDFQGDIANTILAGSNEADFFLQPGANIISFFSADSTVTVTIYWRPNFVSLDDVP